MKPWVEHPAATQELMDAAIFYETHLPGLGESFKAQADICKSQICETPGLFPVRFRGVRRCLFPLVFPYAIYFYERENDIVILAYAHTRRKPNYWRQRLTGDIPE